jgi:purine-binding chemotaxis protein CheW
MKPATVSDSLRVVRCGLAGEAYALDMSCVDSIQRAERLRPCPERAETVGKLPGRAGDVPVFGLAERLGRPPLTAHAGQQVVVLHDGPRTWGLLVERVSQVMRVPAENLFPLPSLAVGAAGTAVQGILRLETELLPLLAAGRLDPDSPDNDSAKSIPAALLGRHQPGDLGLRHGTKSGLGRLVLFATADPRPRERPLVFGLSLARVLEILDLPPLVRVPGAAEYVLGLAAWGGRPVAVIDLAHRLGLPASVGGVRSRLLVVRPPGGAEPLGVVVRPSVRIVRLPLPNRPSVRELALDPSLTRSVLELKRETLVIPDLRKLGQLIPSPEAIGSPAEEDCRGELACALPWESTPGSP